MATNQGFKSFVPNPHRIHAPYLYWWLRANRAYLQSLGNGATFKEVSKTVVSRIAIPLPPISEQRRIAAVLDQADALRAKRRATSDHLDILKKSIFLDMFASQASEEWELMTIEAVAAASPGSLRTGPFGSQLLHSEFVDSGVAVLGIDNAVENEFRWARLRYISPEKFKSLARYTVHPGDVLITIMGTCGRCAIVPDDIPLAINTKHLCCITLDQTSCLSVFLHSYFLHHPLAQQYLRQTAKGAVMDGLNMGIIRQLPLRLPPLPIQEEYGRRISVIEFVEVAHSQSTSAFDDLFGSLQRRAFQGEL
jgi:type I restriction enzyme S subunit